MDRHSKYVLPVLTSCCLVVTSLLVGCRGHQFAHILNDQQADMVGSHAAGSETYNRLIEESVGKLLARHTPQGLPPESFANWGGAKRICFVGVENKSIEELGDFKDQIFEIIDTELTRSSAFQPISKRYVDAGLEMTRLRYDELYSPENQQIFLAAMQRQGQAFDYMLYATITSGTTTQNASYQRDYLLTLELVDLNTGAKDKESAKIRKGYHRSRVGKMRIYNPFKL